MTSGSFSHFYSRKPCVNHVTRKQQMNFMCNSPKNVGFSSYPAHYGGIKPQPKWKQSSCARTAILTKLCRGGKKDGYEAHCELLPCSFYLGGSRDYPSHWR